MAKALKLSLKKSLILEAVKADTYQSGQVDKAADSVKNASLAYNEQAGDEQYQERKLIRFLRSGLARFAAAMNEFVDTESGTLNYTLTDESDNIEIRVVVSDRYNDGLAQPLSSFAEEYVSYTMDYMWWQSIKPNLAKDYFGYAQDTLTQIRLCLAKTAPKASAASYNDVTGQIVGGRVTSIRFAHDIYSAVMGQEFETPVVSTSPAGLTLMFVSSDTSVATVNESTGEVTLVAPGVTTITASYDGSDQYAPATGSYSLLVNPAS
ncbi:MAG: Ig-like domain repeat protein [Prevotella sp.]|nr:Ig-like domain repeat protein [Prevotella sp.]